MRQANEAELREVLTGDHLELKRYRNWFKHVPSDPRCKLCTAPFAGLGGAVLKYVGFGRFQGNEQLCTKCIVDFARGGVPGTEIPVTLLFADIRGSTSIGERLRPAEFGRFIQRFYSLALRQILDHDGIVDKLVGDEVVALFFGGVSGRDHAAKAIEAARDLLAAVAEPDATPFGPIPVGAGVHTGEAYVGMVGTVGAAQDFTALGDAVNTAARLASSAAAGELLVSLAAAEAAGITIDGAESRSLEVRGREGSVEVVSLGASRPA
jgi:adenylate cyclase